MSFKIGLIWIAKTWRFLLEINDDVFLKFNSSVIFFTNELYIVSGEIDRVSNMSWIINCILDLKRKVTDSNY